MNMYPRVSVKYQYTVQVHFRFGVSELHRVNNVDVFFEYLKKGLFFVCMCFSVKN